MNQAHPPTVDQQLAAARAEIDAAREILGALENETLVHAAEDLVREEKTSNEAYHTIHALYWKEAVPAIATLQAQLEHERATNTALSNDTSQPQRKEIDALKLELSSIEYAAHMPDDYAYGMPSWINQVLWASYIGADLSPHIKAEIDALKQERRALCDVLSADSSTVAGQTLAEALKAIIAERDAAEAALGRIRNGEDNSHKIASNALGLCPRCGAPLDNVSPGVSVVAGGVRVCTPCLRPGETEIARARGLTVPAKDKPTEG